MHFLGKVLPGVISSFASQYLPKIAGWAGKKLSSMGNFANDVVQSIQSDGSLGQRMIASWTKARNPNQISLSPQQHQRKQMTKQYVQTPTLVQNTWEDQPQISQDQQRQIMRRYKQKNKKKGILKNKNKRVSFK